MELTRVLPAVVLLLVALEQVHAVAWAAPAPQLPFDRVVADLSSPDADVRLRTVRMLKDLAYEEAALPLARLVLDPDDGIQFEAIAAELNIFLAETIATRRRVGLVIERRSRIAADAIFAAGPLALGARTVPLEVLQALRSAARDDNPRVGLEALYAFGALAVEPRGARRRELLRASAPDLAAMIGAPDPAQRYAALRVIGRLFERHPHDPPVDQRLGDAVIGAVNERAVPLQQAAMQALAALRYERAVRGLTELFAYFQEGEMAEAALDAVARIAHPASVPLLAEQLASRSPTIRCIAIEGLGRAGDRTRLVAIQTALSVERDERVQLAGSFAGVLLSDAGLDRILDALARSRVRDQARWYLVQLSPGRAALLAPYLQDPSPAVRLDVVDALALSDDGAALARLEQMAGDSDGQVARAVERAVARLRQVQ
jgi:HEAT repeat protein